MLTQHAASIHVLPWKWKSRRDETWGGTWCSELRILMKHALSKTVARWYEWEETRNMSCQSSIRIVYIPDGWTACGFGITKAPSHYYLFCSSVIYKQRSCMDAFRCLFPFVDKDFRCGRVLIGNRHTYACASGITCFLLLPLQHSCSTLCLSVDTIFVSYKMIDVL